jgi:hypothetical protein
VGPGIAVPAPKDVVDALESVTIKTSTAEDSGFQLTFTLESGSPLETVLILTSSGALPPLLRVILVATLNGADSVLIDGVVTQHEVTPGDGATFKLTLTGKDLTAVMAWDVLSFDGVPYPATPPEARVLLLLAKYAALGIVPMVIPSVLIDIPIPTHHIPRQKGNDLEYIRLLADEVGYVFYLDPGPVPGTNRAYWGPEIKVGSAQPALNLNLGVEQNVESMSFRFDGEKKRLPIVWIHEEITKAPIPIPIPDITPLNPPLGMVPPSLRGLRHLVGTGKLSPVRAALVGLAVAARSSDAVFAQGTLDVVRYGRLLKARELVGVRGAGMAFDGLYYTTSVTHEIRRGEYKQQFELARNGLVSTVSQVPA